MKRAATRKNNPVPARPKASGLTTLKVDLVKLRLFTVSLYIYSVDTVLRLNLGALPLFYQRDLFLYKRVF